MKLLKRAYSLAEVVVSISVLIVITAMIIPTVKRALPDTDAIKFKQVYQGTLTTIRTLISDAYVYPDVRGFADTSETTDALGVTYSGNSKFSDFFISKLNVVKDNINTGTGKFAYGVNEAGVQSEANAFDCVKVNTGTVFCLPPDVSMLNPKKPNSEAKFYIRVYLKEGKTVADYDEKNAYYIAVRSNGRVSLPTKGVNFDCSDIVGGRMKDRDYKQCLANELLSSSAMPQAK